MADTRYLKLIVETHVRAWLKEKFGVSFKTEFLA
jgi:predicted 3-demethylubiquinone-9 3-methyltransferase (glyoxalase superfamily)